MQFHIVQKNDSASTAVLGDKNESGWDVCSLSAVMWPPHSSQNKACNWVWACPFSPLFDGKG